MVAVILAGGQGSRLRPLTDDLPKALVPVAGYPVISILLTQLARSGVHTAHLCVNHLSEQIEAVVGDGSRFGLRVLYSREPIPLGTIGPLRLIQDLPEQFIVLNADLLTDLPFQNFFAHHRRSSRLLTVAVQQRVEPIDFGVLTLNGDRVVSFAEKPNHSVVVSVGVYAMHRRILSIVPEHRKYGFDHLMQDVLASNEAIGSFVHDGFWLDIGRPTDYLAAQAEEARIRQWLV